MSQADAPIKIKLAIIADKLKIKAVNKKTPQIVCGLSNGGL